MMLFILRLVFQFLHRLVFNFIFRLIPDCLFGFVLCLLLRFMFAITVGLFTFFLRFVIPFVDFIFLPEMCL